MRDAKVEDDHEARIRRLERACERMADLIDFSVANTIAHQLTILDKDKTRRCVIGSGVFTDGLELYGCDGQPVVRCGVDEHGNGVVAVFKAGTRSGAMLHIDHESGAGRVTALDKRGVAVSLGW